MNKFIMEKNFYRPVVKWFINGPFDNKKTIEQIESFEKMGFGGVLPIPITNHNLLTDAFGENNIKEPYLSEKYFEHYEVIIDECRKRKMKIWIWDDVFCPSGWAGGEVVKRYPDLRGVALRRYKKTKKEIQADSKIFHEDKEYLYVIVSSGDIRTDVLNFESTEKFIEINYEAYRKHFQKDFGSTIVGFFTDEPGSAGCINGLFKCEAGYIETYIPWSKDFDKRFEARYEYDIKDCIKYLFIYNIDSDDAEKARFDFANFVQDSFAENYMIPLKKWCNRYNLLYIGHLNNDERLESSLISNGNLLKQLKVFDVSGIDAVFRQITPGKDLIKFKRLIWDFVPYNSNYIKFASSSANLNKTKFSLSEIGDCYGFGMSIDDFKWLVDYHFVRGVNLFTLGHINYSNEKFAVECTASHYGEGNPLRQFYKKLNDYIYKVSRLLSAGTSDIKNAVWNPMTTIFRERVDNINDYFEALCAYLQINGADFDIIGTEEINRKNFPYKTIFIPVGTTLNEQEKKYFKALAKRVKLYAPSSLKLEGAIAYNPYIICYSDFNGSFVDYACKIYSKLKIKYFKDIEFGNCKYIRYIKRKFPKNKIIYFIFNESDRDNFNGKISFNEKGYKILLFDIENDKLLLKEDGFFSLKPKQSVLIILVKKLPAGILKEQKEKKNLVKFDNKWEIEKGEKIIWDGNDFRFIPVRENQIIDSVKKHNFSGWIEYENYFKNKTVYKNFWLSFKKIKYAVLVKVNDKIIGEIVWSPYEIEICKKYIRKGENKVSIIVFNTLADYIRSEEFDKLLDKYCKGNKNIYFKMTDSYDNKKRGIGFKLL